MPLLHRTTSHPQVSSHGGSTADHNYTAGSPSVPTQVTMRVIVITPLKVTPSLASKPEPPSLPGTMTGMLLWTGTLVMGLTRLIAWWKGSDDSSDGWMTLHTCKQRCKPPSTHRPA
jgi:hypothetical protein